MPRTVRDSGVTPLPDRYGRQSIPGTKTIVTDRKMRAWTSARNKFTHRAKNGVYDPYTYFHLVEELSQLKPWQSFTASQFADWLNGTRPQFIWDAVTVGRILNDLRESWDESNPGARHQPLIVTRRWNGTYYETTDYASARAVLFALVEDLASVGEGVYTAEQEGRNLSRLVSPLSNCASLADLVADMA